VTAQRIRVWFRKGDRVRYISHLDVLRYWERAIRRAGLPLSYSQGFTPHPKLAFAGPLPLGYAADADIMDITFDERVDPGTIAERLAPQSSEDLTLIAAVEVPLSNPPPQSVLLWADYRVDVPGLDPADAAAALAAFLARTEFPWTEERRDKSKSYDLRAMVASAGATAIDGGARIACRMRASQESMARPEQILAALFPGFEGQDFCRVSLILDEVSPARDLYRRRGRFLE